MAFVSGISDATPVSARGIEPCSDAEDLSDPVPGSSDFEAQTSGSPEKLSALTSVGTSATRAASADHSIANVSKATPKDPAPPLSRHLDMARAVSARTNSAVRGDASDAVTRTGSGPESGNNESNDGTRPGKRTQTPSLYPVATVGGSAPTVPLLTPYTGTDANLVPDLGEAAAELSMAGGPGQAAGAAGASNMTATGTRAAIASSQGSLSPLSGTPPAAGSHAAETGFSVTSWVNAPALAEDRQANSSTRGEIAPARTAAGMEPSTPVSAGLTGAQLTQSLGRSEMQLHWNGAEFGRISVHASYGREGIAAQISVHNTELGSALGAALSSHVPTMEQKLSASQGMRASVTVNTGAGTNAGEGRDRGNGAQPERRSSPNLQSFVTSSTLEKAAAPVATVVLPTLANSGRLDIRI